jgi:hypothetical protein
MRTSENAVNPNFPEFLKAEVHPPDTPVNKPWFELLIRWFIRDSSSCVPLLGVSATRLDNASLQASHPKERRLHTVVGLLAEVLVLVLVMASWWWGIMTLASHSLASESGPLAEMGEPIYVAGCPVADTLKKSSAGGGVGKGCSKEGSSHPISSRQQGGGPAEHGRGGER